MLIEAILWRNILLFRNPWVILFIESIDGFSNFLTYLAGSYFCAAAAPPGMLGSLNGILSAAVFGAGKSTKGKHFEDLSNNFFENI